MDGLSVLYYTAINSVQYTLYKHKVYKYNKAEIPEEVSITQA